MGDFEKLTKTVELKDPRLQGSVVMTSVTIACRTQRALSPNHSNVVLVTHRNPSGPSMLGTDAATGEGTWSTVVGPGRVIDTDRYFVVCPNMLGWSSSSINAASIDLATGRPYSSRFPDITVGDIVATQRKLLDRLEIPKLVAIAGASYCGIQGFQWAVDRPDDLKGPVAVVTAPFVSRFAGRAHLARLPAALPKGGNWNGGDRYERGGVETTLTDIRIPTLMTDGVDRRLGETIPDPEGVERAIRASAARRAQEFGAASLIILTKALVGFNTVPRFERRRVKTLYVLSRTDRVFRPLLAPPVMAALKRRASMPATSRSTASMAIWPRGRAAPTSGRRGCARSWPASTDRPADRRTPTSPHEREYGGKARCTRSSG